jgi:hypothetical protein
MDKKIGFDALAGVQRPAGNFNLTGFQHACQQRFSPRFLAGKPGKFARLNARRRVSGACV